MTRFLSRSGSGLAVCLLSIGLLTAVVVPESTAAADASSTAVSDAPSASDTTTASQIAETYGHSVVVDPATTQTEQISAQPDGSMQLVESSQPVRVRQSSGWVPLNLNLAQAGGTIAPAAAAVPVEFSAGGSGPALQVQAADGSWLSQSWAFGSLPTPTVSGASATYPEVFPGVDLVLTATPTGVSQVLVIKSAAAASDPQLSSVSFTVAGTSLAAVSGTGTGPSAAAGSAAVRSTNAVVAASPSWWDSSAAGSGPTGPGGSGMPAPVADSVAGNSVTINAATALASRANLHYPAYVDPDWSVGATGWNFVDSAYPTQSYWKDAGASDAYQHVGYVQPAWSDDGLAHTARSFWSLDVAPMLSTYVTSATLSTTEVYAPSCTASRVELWGSGAISASNTWNNQPGLSSLLDYKTVAWGYSSACTARAVGFNATSALQYDAGHGISVANFALKAQNEADTYSWKKFAQAVTLTVTYDTTPGTPASLGVTPDGFGLANPVYTNSQHPTITGKSSHTDVSGHTFGNLYYFFEVWSGHSASPTTEVTSVQSSPAVAPDVLVPWAIPMTMGDGDYEYRVRSYDGELYSAWSGWTTFTVVTALPKPPALSASPHAGGTGVTDTTANPGGGPTGTVGVTQEDVTITPAADDYAYGYVWTMRPSGSQITWPTNLDCNQTVAAYHVVCYNQIGQVGAPKTITVTMPDDLSTFAAESFDAAGNTDSNTAPNGSRTASRTFSANGDWTATGTGASYASDLGHSWSTEAYDSTKADSNGCEIFSTTPLADTADKGGAPATGSDVTAASGACWTADSTMPSPGSITGGELNYTGAAATVATTGPVIDTSKSFTVAAWLKPATTMGSGQGESAIVQAGTNESAFYLEYSQTSWALCIPSSDAVSYSGACVTLDAGAVAGQWRYVAGVYDAANHQLMLYVGTSDQITTPAITTNVSAPTSTGPVLFGQDRLNSVTRYWNGEIADPVVMQGVADKNQLQQMADLVAPHSFTHPAGL